MPKLRRSHADSPESTYPPQHGAHDGAHDEAHAPHHDGRTYGDRRDYDADERTLAERRHEEHGGFKPGATFFGWLVAVALTVLLAGIIGALATAAGSSVSVTRAEAAQQAGTIGIATAIVTLLVLMVAYFAGGYVAGRMARFDGARQGLGVWVLGLVIALIVAGIGALFGSQYNVFNRVDLASIPVPTEALTTAGVIAVAAVLLGTVVAAIVGGKVGQRYHTKVDRTPL